MSGLDELLGGQPEEAPPAPSLVRRMADVISCKECPAIFTSPNRWTEFAEHIRAEHPEPSSQEEKNMAITDDEPRTFERAFARGSALNERLNGESIEHLLDRVAALGEALNRFGWHHDQCPAYASVLGDSQLATESDDPKEHCSCSFRSALALLDSPTSVARGGVTE